MMMKNLRLSGGWMSVLVCLFFLQTAKAASPPNWYDVASHAKLVVNKAKTPAVKYELQKFQSKKISLGSHHLQLVTANFGAGKVASENDYSISEIFSDPPESAKPLFQLIDKNNCDAKVVDEVSVKKLGFVADVGVYFTQVKLISPHCVHSEILNPKIFMVIQEKKKSLEKVYESSIANDGKYVVNFENKMVRLDYTKGLETKSTQVSLSWDEKSESFTEQP